MKTKFLHRNMDFSMQPQLYFLLPSVMYVYCLPSNWVVFVNT